MAALPLVVLTDVQQYDRFVEARRNIGDIGLRDLGLVHSFMLTRPPSIRESRKTRMASRS